MIKDFLIERRNNPLGIDENPHFSWKLVSKKQNVMQKQYQIQVTSHGKLIWDSGIVESNQSVQVPYAGKKLVPMTRYEVMVNVWNNYGELLQEKGFFETGLMGEANWKASWITHDLPEGETDCPIFTRCFVAEKKIKEARLYATALGVYEAKINDCKVGDAFLAPGWTSYHNRIQYQTYDITSLLSQKNEIDIMVGNGWYKGELGFDARPDIYGDRTALLAMLRIEYEDGATEFIGTDNDWKIRTGEVRFSEIYHGEIQDYVQKGKEISTAVLVKNAEDIGKVISQESEPVRITKRFEVQKKIITPKGEVVFDFGQNMAGLVEITLPELVGDKLIVRHAETLDKDGNFYTENLRTARCTDIYVYGKDQVGMRVIPHFTFHGFRYICVEGAGDTVSAEHFTACALHTDMQVTGTFSSDNKLVDQLQNNIQWGQRGNFLDVPTDCPQRDERLGWTGDAQVFCGTASYNFNTALFFKKWIRDMAVETDSEWGVPHVVPNIL